MSLGPEDSDFEDGETKPVDPLDESIFDDLAKKMQ